ncbi:MAG TPA: cytochrome c [Gemmatimonadales bacterium]
MRPPPLARLGLALLLGCGPRREAAPAAAGADSASVSATAANTTATAVAPQAQTTAAPPVRPTPAPPPAAPPGAVAKPKRPSPPTPSAPESTAADQPLHDVWHPAARDTLGNDTYQGWKQYELNCSRCHGEYAVGTSFAPALVVSLKEGGTIPTKEAFITTVCAGRPDKGMPAWCALGLEMEKIERMYLYIKGRADAKISAGRPALKE